MKKTIIFLVLALSLSLCACGGSAAAESTPAPSPTAASTTVPAPESVPTPSPEAAPALTGWQADYTAFLTERFDDLAKASGGAIAGVGFIDLDLDGTPELLLFDPGAGSAMGVQFFDIAPEGGVVCVSASAEGFGYAFGGEYFSPRLYVNTTSFQAFRLREDAAGQLYFEVDSYNGGADFRYSERIRFTSAEGVLSLETVACQQTALDPETQTELYTVYTVGDTPIDEGTYRSILERSDQAADLGYEAAGVFLWDGPSYGVDWAGFSAMLSDAIAAYVPAL